MKRTFLILFWLMVCVPLGAQTIQRDSVLAQARYLKSIYKTDEAIEALSALVKPEVFDEEILSELADCHFQSGDFESAAGTYFMLSARNPRNLQYLIRQMQVYSRLKAYPQSIEAGRAVLQVDSIPAVMSFMGDSFRQMEEADSALWYYRRSLAWRPMNATVVSKAFDVLLRKEAYDEAIDLTDQYLSQDPDNEIIAPLNGLARFRKGDYDKALEVFQRQLDLGNETYPIHYYLGQSYWHTSRVYKADSELKAAWQIDSSDVNLAYSIAAVEMELMLPFEDYSKPWLDKAWEMSQPDYTLWSRIQQLYGQGYYQHEHDYKKAIGYYSEAYKNNPKLISALSTIGYCYELEKDYKRAMEWYEKYLKVANPDSRGYATVTNRLNHVKSELFMEEGK
jgi:tetratricopeptide (TPR) repeat protein